MKRLTYSIVLVLLTILTACNTGEKKERVILTNISGELNDVLVVMEDASWASNSGKALKSILHEEYYGLPQYETMFKAIQIKHSDFSNIFQLYRNIIDVKISDNVKASKIWYGKDVYARPQAFLKIEAKNSLEFIELINTNAGKIQAYFKKAEIARLQNSYKNHFSVDIMKHTMKKFGIKVDIPANYKLETDSLNFSWIAFESPQMSQGIFIYSYSYQDTSQFNLKNIIETRDYFLKRFVPGPSKGSYMQTEPQFPPKRTAAITKDGFYSVFVEGLWRVKGDFMGGPFVSYSFVDKKKEEIICIDAYVYGPKKDKRNFIMQLEAIAKTARYE